MSEEYSVPVHRSLAEVILIGGLPRTVAILLWTTAGAAGFGMQQLWVLPVAIVLHVVLAMTAKRDPHFFDVFVRALKSPKRLDP
ncbi:type IV secretory pathway VirB3 family protein (plasmid) [Prosthecochloris aestuarii DSM 271]|uniref:Type IV secretory pathway VirB3 family protein n=1 Tax=Prosthecochloris aestuarii (strain DSM 271 / SK 413) TaxID=290512 RepID=B4S9L2_PROA2|nr:VirB3 family type IV secretion system protein [Prosthecochloris aestuarii]ACF47339.1 type IV secretory pathway VirB3 family protein [Prosthecochloris aestuarii DSM 271]